MKYFKVEHKKDNRELSAKVGQDLNRVFTGETIRLRYFTIISNIINEARNNIMNNTIEKMAE